MGDQRITVGRFGEDIAARFLSERGFVIVDRNWSSRDPRGELDIIARESCGDLVFVEVKTRRTLGVGDPVAGVTPDKLVKLRRLAAKWLQLHPEVRPPCIRFDVVGVLVGRRPEPSVVQHVQGVV